MNVIGFLFVGVLFLPVLLAAGIATVWILNTLFALGIAYTLKTALAAGLLVSLFGLPR